MRESCHGGEGGGGEGGGREGGEGRDQRYREVVRRKETEISFAESPTYSLSINQPLR